MNYHVLIELKKKTYMLPPSKAQFIVTTAAPTHTITNTAVNTSAASSSDVELKLIVHASAKHNIKGPHRSQLRNSLSVESGISTCLIRTPIFFKSRNIVSDTGSSSVPESNPLCVVFEILPDIEAFIAVE